MLAGRGATAGPLIGGAGGSVGTGPETLLAQSARPSPVFVWHVDLNGASPPPEMHIWLLRKARSQLERALCLSKDANALHTAAVLLLQYSLALVVAASTPFVIRRLALPSSVHNEIELNLSFNTCSSELHGICSFPAATVEYEKGDLFSPSVTYALSVRLRFADIEQGQKLGIFQNVISFYDGDNLLKTYSKSTYLKEPTFFNKAMWVVFFPLYFCGMFHDYSLLEVPLTTAHTETSVHSSSKLLFQLQDRFAQIDSAVLMIDARFGIIRHLLYDWPLLTSSILFAVSFAACCTTIVLYWGAKGVAAFSKESEKSLQSHLLSAEGPARSSNSAPLSVESDEYIPENIDEVPSSCDFSQIPGWNIRATLEDSSKGGSTDTINSVRKRKG